MSLRQETKHHPFVRRSVISILFLFLLTLGFQGCAETLPSGPVNQPVSGVNLERYQGLWYEIASLPAWFQKDCACTTAEYILEKDFVQVINRCRRGGPEGKWDEAKGKALPVDGSNNAKLKVSFFWPFKGDYWVIALDPDYQWVMVGHPKKTYLWILNRTPRMDENLYQSLVAKARAMGYPVERLRLNDQSCR